MRFAEIVRGPDLSDADAARWAAIRQRGRRRYIVVSGVLGWGVPTAILTTTFMQLVGGVPGPFLGRLALGLVTFPLGGIWFGAWMWSVNERRYLEWSRTREG